jgi:pantetheine-phosphate adenylyltransferase
MNLAVYPGSFDPITNGHLDVVRRAASLFDTVTIAIYDGVPKRGALFTPEERVALAAQAVADEPRISVQTYQGLTIEFARQVGARFLVRGLRGIGDFDHELQLAHMYRQLAPEIEVIYLMTTARFSFVSSSLIREVASLGGDISDFVPVPVAQALTSKLRNSHGS